MPTTSIEKFIFINAPVWRVYGYWGRAQNFPEFNDAVHEVHRIDTTQLRWKERIGGKDYETLVEVDNLPAGECGFAWKTIAGPVHEGIIFFKAESDGRTSVSVKMKYSPAVGSPSALAYENKLEHDLRSFRKFVESEQTKVVFEHAGSREKKPSRSK